MWSYLTRSVWLYYLESVFLRNAFWPSLLTTQCDSPYPTACDLCPDPIVSENDPLLVLSCDPSSRMYMVLDPECVRPIPNPRANPDPIIHSMWPILPEVWDQPPPNTEGFLHPPHFKVRTHLPPPTVGGFTTNPLRDSTYTTKYMNLLHVSVRFLNPKKCDFSSPTVYMTLPLP